MQAFLRKNNIRKACNLKFFSYYVFMEEKLNLHEIHVTCDAYLGEDGIDECSEMQIIREKFGGMENWLYLCGIVNLV